MITAEVGAKTRTYLSVFCHVEIKFSPVPTTHLFAVALLLIGINSSLISSRFLRDAIDDFTFALYLTPFTFLIHSETITHVRIPLIPSDLSHLFKLLNVMKNVARQLLLSSSIKPVVVFVETVPRHQRKVFSSVATNL